MNRIKKTLFFIVTIITTISLLCSCGKKYKPNDKLLDYADEEMAELCLNMILEYQYRLEEFKKNPEQDVDDLFTGEYIDEFKYITLEDWTGISDYKAKHLSEEQFYDYKDSVEVWVDMAKLQYLVADAWLNHSVGSGSEFSIEEDYVEDFEKDMQKAIDKLLEKYFSYD